MVLNSLTLGISLLFLGTVLLLLTLALLRFVPQLQLHTTREQLSPLPVDLPEHNEAVLLVQAGGRVIYMNQAARQLFNLWTEEPSIEQMARRAHPTETFLRLCATEGQAQLSLNGRFVEGHSYLAPYGFNQVVLVALHRPQIVVEQPSLSEGTTDSETSLPASESVDYRPAANQALYIFTELSQKMAASLDLETTLQSILEGVQHLIVSDYSEVTVWDKENQHLVPYRLVGSPGIDQRLEKSNERYHADEGYSGYLITHRVPLLITDVDVFRQARPAIDRRRYPFQSYVGLPLLVAGDLVGTLELASLVKNNFSAQDLESLRMLSGQASFALHNALIYQKEQIRAMEISGLVNLAQTISTVRDPQDMFARLIDCIAPLLHAEILGFLVYDENRLLLSGQVPFLGIHASAIELWQATIQANSPAEKILLSGNTILTAEASEDQQLAVLGLPALIAAAGIHQCILVPLTSRGRMLGYLLAANKPDHSAFDANDQHMLAIIASQVSPIIENAALFQESRRRAQRSETLRRIASLTGSTATLDEILKYSLLDLARLLRADVAAIYLLDESRCELRLQKYSIFGIPPEVAYRFLNLPVDISQIGQTVSGSQRQLMAGNVPGINIQEEDAQIYAYLRPLLESLQIQSLIDVPLIVRQRGIGELILGSIQSDFFERGDLLSAVTAAGQLASAIEQATLILQTDQSLRQRIEQMTAITRISREINATFDLQRLLRLVYDEIIRTTRADCGSIYFFKIDSEFPTVSIEQTRRSAPAHPQNIILLMGDHQSDASTSSATGTSSMTESSSAMATGLITTSAASSVEQLLDLERYVLRQGETVIVQDFDDQAGGTVPIWQPAHQGVRSALLTPIAYQGKIVGLIHLHAFTPHHFDRSAQDISEGLATQAAIALGNVHRFQEQVRRGEMLNRRVETLSKLFETSQILQGEQPLEQSLEVIAYAIQSTTPFDVVMISIYDEQNDTLRLVAGVGVPARVTTELKTHTQPWSNVQRILDPANCLGNTYFIPHASPGPVTGEQVPAIPPMGLTGSLISEDTTNLWHPDDYLLSPLYGAHGQPLGLIRVDSPRNSLRPDQPTIETLEIFASQASLVIENQQKLFHLTMQVADMQRALDRTQKAAQSVQSYLPMILHKDLEQTLALQQLSLRAGRIQAGLGIVEAINRQVSREDVLATFGREILLNMGMDIVMVAEPSPNGLRLLNAMGALPTRQNPEALLGKRNPLRTVIQSGRILLVPDRDNHPDWKNSSFMQALEVHSFVCLPIPSSAVTNAPSHAITAAVLAMCCTNNRSPATSISLEEESLFALLCKQVSHVLQNLDLLNETDRRLRELNLLLDFSRKLGSLDPINILQSLVDSAIHAAPGSHAGMVAMWDSRLNRLIPQAASGYANNARMLEIAYLPGEALPGQTFESGQPIIINEVEFARHYYLSPENLICYRDATRGRFPVSSMAIPIQAPSTSSRTSPGGQLGVLILDNLMVSSAFTPDDLALITSLAQQTALLLENARLYQASEQRAHQLQALTNITTTITSSLETDELIATLLDQLQSILPYDTGTLWLRETTYDPVNAEAERHPFESQKMVVRAARGFADSDQRIGLSVHIKDSLLMGEMLTTSMPLYVPDVVLDPRFPPLIEYERRCWLGLPLMASGEVIGVIALEKAEPDYYKPEAIQMATSFAGQAAVALENANLYQQSLRRAQELDQRSQVLSMLNRLSSELSGSLDLVHILRIATEEIFNILHCSSASAVLFEPQGSARIMAEFPPTIFNLPYTLPAAPLYERLRETQGIYISESISTETDLQPLGEFLAQHDTHSLLILPLVTGNDLHGLLFIHSNLPYRFTADEVALARTISNQVAIAVQNAQLFAETRSLTQDLEQRVEARTAELGREHLRTQTLLRILTELSASLDLEQVLTRTLRVLNEMIAAEQISVWIARTEEKMLNQLAIVGNPQLCSPDISQNLADRIIARRQSMLSDDLTQIDHRESGSSTSTGSVSGSIVGSAADQVIHSVLGAPLMVGPEALGALLLLHRQTGSFSPDQLDLVQAVANQVAVAVNNAELYRLIRDQAEDLGSMLRNQQIETSRTRAILEAVADGVLVTDARKTITLFNASAETILGLNRSEVLGKSLEHFTGLFGKAAQTWMNTIHEWSQNPASRQGGLTTRGVSHAEQISLENGRVVAVHLSPVTLRGERARAGEFLGTVSIFQDITHQVEVDRLKSEFVATVSHELRTPMTSIKGYVEILLMGAAGPLSEQQRRFLDTVKVNTERLAILVNDLLDISHIESGKATLSLQPLSLQEIAQNAMNDLERRCRQEGKQVTLETIIAPDVPHVLGDPDRVPQILSNLLDNAYHYNIPNGKVTLHIHPASEAIKDHPFIQIDVQDTGMGIPREEQSRIFERFFRGENPLVLGVSGTGLGLSIVKYLVEMHGGRIWLESNGVPGEGSTFSFTLPVYPTENNGA